MSISPRVFNREVIEGWHVTSRVIASTNRKSPGKTVFLKIKMN